MPDTHFHESAEDALRAACDSIAAAEGDDRWMVAVFRVEPDGSVRCDCHRWQWPADAHPQAVDALSRNRLPAPDPLPRATLPLPFRFHPAEDAPPDE